MHMRVGILIFNDSLGALIMYQVTVYARKPGTQLVSLLRGNPVYAASLSGASPVCREHKGPCLILLFLPVQSTRHGTH